MTTSPLNIRAEEQPYSFGATAHELSLAPEPVTTGGQSTQSVKNTRPKLSVVSAPLKSAPKGFIVLCLGILIAALLGVLLTNIIISNRQYDMLELSAQRTELTQANEKLAQEVSQLSAPQNVAARAADLGMVLPAQTASIDLETGKVTGTAAPATTENKPTGFVGSPTVTSAHGTPAVTELEPEELNPVTVDTAPVAGPPAGSLKIQAPTVSIPKGDTAQNTSKKSAGQADLNSGSLPGPEIQVPGN